MTEPVVDPIWETEHALKVAALCMELRELGCVVAVWSAEDIQRRYLDMKENEEWEVEQGHGPSDDIPLEAYDLTFERAQEILDLHKESISRDAAEAGESYLDYDLTNDPRKEVPSE